MSKATLLKRRIQDYFSEKEVKELVAEVKLLAPSHPELLKFLIEQLFGKAPQKLQMPGDDDEANALLILPAEIITKNQLGGSA